MKMLRNRMEDRLVIYRGGGVGSARDISLCSRMEDRLMNYLLAHELFTKINHEPIDLHYKFNIYIQ